MHSYISLNTKFYTDLTTNESIVLSAINQSLLTGCDTKDERTIYTYGLLSHILTSVAIRNNIKRLIIKERITVDLIPIQSHTPDNQITTIIPYYATPGRKHSPQVNELNNIITSINDAHS